MELDGKMRELVKQLGAAINEALSDSESVSDALADLREAGYDVFLILEATIGLQRRDPEPAGAQQFSALPSGELLLTPQDAQFLKSLKICVAAADDQPSTAP